MKEKILSRCLRLTFASSLVIGMGVLAHTTYAQDTSTNTSTNANAQSAASTPNTQAIQKVQITGTSIKRVASETSLPVQTFSKKDIEKSGVSTVSDFIQQLPVMQGFTTPSDSVGGGGAGVTTASIHDIGESYTLVLLNGRRVSSFGSHNEVNLKNIPLSAIERIEVLTDGASALYGSDAIAGVVNFILKEGVSPITISAKFTAPQHPGGKGFDLGISGGWGDMQEQGWNLFASYSHNERKQLRADQRPYAKTGIIRFKSPVDGSELLFFNGSARAIPANVTVRDENDDALISFNPYLKANGKCAPLHQKSGSQCYFDYTSTIEISPEEKSDAIYLNGKLKLNENFHAFSQFAYVEANTIPRRAPQPAEFALSATNPLFTQYITPFLDPADAALATSATVKYRLYELGNRVTEYPSKALHWVTGLEGTIAQWDVNTAFTYSVNRRPTIAAGGYAWADKWDAAINTGSFDPFGYTRGTLPPQMKQTLQNMAYRGLWDTNKGSMLAWDAHASREIGNIEGRGVMLGLGVDFRKNKFTFVGNPAVNNGQILSIDPFIDEGYHRSNSGAYAEVVAPVMKGLELTGAVRYDNVSAVHNQVTNTDFGKGSNATTYKLSTRWQPSQDVMVRAAYGTGFKPASMSSIASPLQNAGVTGGTYICPFSGALSSHPLAKYCNGKTQYEMLSGGNANLTPEKSQQYSVGIVFEPVNDLSVSLDYWNVSIKDAISAVSEEQIMADPLRHIKLFTTKYIPSTGLNALAIMTVPTNIGKQENAGVDYDITLRSRVMEGKWTNRLAGTYLMKSRATKPGTFNEWNSDLNVYGELSSSVSFKNIWKFSSTFEKGDWTHYLSLNYRNGYKDKYHDLDNCAVESVATGDCVAIALNVPAYYTVDWQTQYRLSKNIDLSAGISNLLDKDPPLSLRSSGSDQLGYDPRYASSMGRTFYISASYKF